MRLTELRVAAEKPTNDNQRESSQSFEASLGRLRAHLFDRARMLTRDRAAADDLAQETLEKMLAARAQFQPGTNLRAWANVILRNRFVDGWRQKHFMVPENMQAAPETRAAVPGPIDLLTVADVIGALDLLCARDREVFTLAYLERLSYRDIATRLGIPMGTVCTRVFRAKLRIRRTLEGIYESKMGGGV
jgi:RNA polymerase sigma-70 factor (ECF subfamily)